MGESGKGKSTLLEAIIYALYGRQKKVYNRDYGKGKPTTVSIKLDDLFIERTNRSLKVNHMIDEVAQGFIDATFGTYDLFMVTSYLRAEEIHPLLSTSQKEKVDVMKHIFPETSKFGHYREKVRHHINMLSSDRSRIENEMIRCEGAMGSIRVMCPLVDEAIFIPDDLNDLEERIIKVRSMQHQLDTIHVLDLPDVHDVRVIESMDDSTLMKQKKLEELGPFDENDVIDLTNTIIVPSKMDIIDEELDDLFICEEKLDDLDERIMQMECLMKRTPKHLSEMRSTILPLMKGYEDIESEIESLRASIDASHVGTITHIGDMESVKEIIEMKLPYERFEPDRVFDEIVKLGASGGDHDLNDLLEVMKGDEIAISSSSASHTLSDNEIKMIKMMIRDNIHLTDEQKKEVKAYKEWKIIDDRYSHLRSYRAKVTKAQIDSYPLIGKTSISQKEMDEMKMKLQHLQLMLPKVQRWRSLLTDDEEIEINEFRSISSELHRLKEIQSKLKLGKRPCSRDHYDQVKRSSSLKGKVQLLQEEYDEMVRKRSKMDEYFTILRSIINDGKVEMVRHDYERHMINTERRRQRESIMKTLSTYEPLDTLDWKIRNKRAFTLKLQLGEHQSVYDRLKEQRDIIVRKMDEAKMIEITLSDSYNMYVSSMIESIAVDVQALVSRLFVNGMVVELVSGKEGSMIKPSFNIIVNGSSPSELSTGERKRLSIILMVVLSMHVNTSRKMLILDESLNSISPDLRMEIVEEIQAMKLNSIITTHDSIPIADETIFI